MKKIKTTLVVLGLGLLAVLIFSFSQNFAPQQKNAEREGLVTGVSAWALDFNQVFDSSQNR
ncbi:hypothetical protein JOD43_002625 [Pullulanibacillus pueri]|uniref:Uncharacterized protein n=1 Tax=Pullulanibacillus pueri TaxID=1437324 RepID=A0A8J2ZW61_9BACL|nr:hypothetical protein [Pullulanibacillus pueri]MBM7682448.1 hypothetical protein [Pullulanibacillus pueri]GGH81599.1 hypothetical protein GCM10007096_19730 [Pullulanibacillus pueri]